MIAGKYTVPSGTHILCLTRLCWPENTRVHRKVIVGRGKYELLSFQAAHPQTSNLASELVASSIKKA